MFDDVEFDIVGVLVVVVCFWQWWWCVGWDGCVGQQFGYFVDCYLVVYVFVLDQCVWVVVGVLVGGFVVEWFNVVGLGGVVEVLLGYDDVFGWKGVVLVVGW